MEKWQNVWQTRWKMYLSIKFGDYNIGRDGDLLTLPTYMQFLLDLEPEDVVLEPIDTEELTRLARDILG